MRGYLYAGESDGGRVVRFTSSKLTQITTAGTTPVLSSIEVRDFEPAGASGDSVFRLVAVKIKYSNGYSVRVTPKVDGVEQEAQSFSGAGAGTATLSAWVKTRGTRISVKAEQLARTGDLEWSNVQVSYVVIREAP